ncbi:MAG: hypothetical protein UIB61_05170 [Treponema sp.]|nr:hypothetical protein [Treponema sp.]
MTPELIQQIKEKYKNPFYMKQAINSVADKFADEYIKQEMKVEVDGVVKGNATLSRINLARAKLTVAMLDTGEKIGICGRTGSNGRYFKERMNELARKYRAEKKRKKCLQ